ncbi:MAG: TIGR00282 family metallophosphoesterase [Candidatus Saganbacteria bacterium]|nr:TIGR00282 family metallophosphoesterase [Candidatus Saganbacteria bacterium]
MNILFIGDIVGSYGRAVVKQLLPGLKKEYAVDLTVANGENSAHGYSITEKIYHELLELGIDALTMGNHLFEKKELVQKIDGYDRLCRPANLPSGTPGRDHLLLDVKGTKVALINLLGRVFMQCVDCPFQAADRLLPLVREQAGIILVDFHGEATSEKAGLGYYLAGRVAAVLGTHTHVMTADERVLPGGTAFVTDVGMAGSQDSVIGMNKEQIIKRFVTQMPEKFEPTDYGPGLFNAVVITIDAKTGQATAIKRIQRVTEPLALTRQEKND